MKGYFRAFLGYELDRDLAEAYLITDRSIWAGLLERIRMRAVLGAVISHSGLIAQSDWS